MAIACAADGLHCPHPCRNRARHAGRGRSRVRRRGIPCKVIVARARCEDRHGAARGGRVRAQWRARTTAAARGTALGSHRWRRRLPGAGASDRGGHGRRFEDSAPRTRRVAVRRGSVRARRATANALLTPKEVEVLQLMEQGLSNKRIAQTLDVGGETVKWTSRTSSPNSRRYRATTPSIGHGCWGWWGDPGRCCILSECVVQGPTSPSVRALRRQRAITLSVR